MDDVFEFEIYIPTTVDPDLDLEKELKKFRNLLVERFGGLTDTRQHNEGIWKYGSVEMHDQIVIWRVLSEHKDSISFLRQVKSDMEKTLQQTEILVVCRKILRL